MRIAIVVVFVLLAVCACHGHRTNEMRDNKITARMHKGDKVADILMDPHVLRFFIELDKHFKAEKKHPSSSSSFVADSDYDDDSASSSTEEMEEMKGKDKITKMTRQEMWDHLNQIEDQYMTKQQLLHHLINRRVQLKMTKHEIKKLNSLKIISQNSGF